MPMCPFALYDVQYKITEPVTNSGPCEHSLASVPVEYRKSQGFHENFKQRARFGIPRGGVRERQKAKLTERCSPINQRPAHADGQSTDHAATNK